MKLSVIALLPFHASLHQEDARREPPALELVQTVRTAGAGAEIVSVQASTKRAVLTHSKSGQVELLDLSDPAAPRSVKTFDVALGQGESMSSVALPPKGDWFLAAIKAGPQLAAGRTQAHSLADGKLLASFPCGVSPDSVVIAPSGTRAVVANEAEGFALVEGRLVSAPGGVTLIRFAPGLMRGEAAVLKDSVVTQIAFECSSNAPTDDRVIERKIDGDSQDLELQSTPEYFEPEGIVFLPDEKRALMTLQEANQVAYVDLEAGKLERYVPLGNTTHAADLVEDKRYGEDGKLIARREPDGLALTPDGRYFVTADEGDTEPDLDETPPGKPGAGARTLSVFDLQTGEFVGDTGPELDRMAAKAGLYPENRSNNKGSEPEMVVTFVRGGRSYAAVTLERAGALALVDLSDPKKPTVVAISRSGEDNLKDEPEGLAHFGDPAGKHDYFYVANEGTGTLGVLRVLR